MYTFVPLNSRKKDNHNTNAMSWLIRWRRLSTSHKCIISTAAFTITALGLNYLFSTCRNPQILHTPNLYENFEKASLKDLETGTSFPAKHLWKSNPIVLLAIRRPG